MTRVHRSMPQIPGTAGSAASARAAGFLLLLLLAATLIVVGCRGKTPPAAKSPAVASEAGNAAGSGSAAPNAVAQAIAEEKKEGKELYICPMHPTYHSDRPGDCPICGMRLVPAEQVSAGSGGTGAPGMAAIRLSAEGIRLAGVQTAAAVTGGVSRTIRTVGTVSADESRVRRVQVKVEGYIERLLVNTPGQAVRKGDPLLSIYSPDLLAGQEEYLRAYTAAQAAGEAQKRDADLLAGAARDRLRLLDVPEPFIQELERTRKPSRTVMLRAPVSGVVTDRQAYEGMKVMPGMELFTITDLSQVWIEGSFYESEAPLVSVGSEATLTLAYDPSVSLQGAVEFVYPYLDPESRTLRARFSFSNAGGVLKPGMYANVTLAVSGSEGVVVPDNAVMDTGERKIVFVSKGDGLFEPREVETGRRGDGRLEVLSGLMAGDEVVVHANFLLDSESRIRSALSGGGPAPVAPAGEEGQGTAPAQPAGQGAGSMPGMPGMPGGK
jgi:membrane fusion protein, copper/silver efflux system